MGLLLRQIEVYSVGILNIEQVRKTSDMRFRERPAAATRRGPATLPTNVNKLICIASKAE